MEIRSQKLESDLTPGRISTFAKQSIAISHLLFSDDLLIFAPITKVSGRLLKKLLLDCAELSGLEFNSDKSALFCGGREDLHQQFILELGIPKGSLPVNYLGLPLFTGALNSRLCLPLVDKMRKRLQCWHGTIKALEKMIRSFLWGGPTLRRTLNHVNWRTVYLPKVEGGLGLKRIGEWSKAALGARFWEVAVGSQSIWATWISRRYLHKQSIWTMKPSISGSWIWPKILAARSWITPQVQYLIFSGEGVSAWDDPWIQGASLSELTSTPGTLRDPLMDLQVAAMINQGQWTKPPWWDTSWDLIWDQIQEMECGGQGADILIWPHSISGALFSPMAWEFLRTKAHTSRQRPQGVWSPTIQKLAENWGITILPLQCKQFFVTWRPPEVDWVKSNSDGALSADRAGYEAVMRDHTWALVEAVVVQEPRLQSINLLAHKAILHGLKLAAASGLPKVHMESDSTTAIAWVHGKGCIPWRALRTQTELINLLPSFDAWQASHVFHEGNQVADHLASWRDTSGSTTIAPHEAGQELQKLLAQDAIGTIYTRTCIT
ncbi:hypothetical protein QJS10_CPB14g01038 [Acorus calamus]|uniref:RNase H type-1 domain-containing protein n=1 Tax=Acorus calamus TaxID=4465 RepID=A0AAV9DG00_ACOCL|nr:hypothetical protein QJS10_CPB14g01038 [Acorus calamus]